MVRKMEKEIIEFHDAIKALFALRDNSSVEEYNGTWKKLSELIKEDK